MSGGIDYFRLENFIKKYLCEQIRNPQLRGIFERSEEQVKISLVVPILELLGWNIKNPLEVLFENPTVTGGRMDIVLKKDNKSVFLIEVKNLSQTLTNHLLQLGRYLYEQGISYGAITNGKEWIFFEAFAEGTTLKERILVNLDLCDETTLKVIPILSCISKNNVGNLRDCIKAHLMKIYKYIQQVKEKSTKTKCPTQEPLEEFICAQIYEEIKKCVKKLEEQLPKEIKNEPKDIFSSTSSKNIDTSSNKSSNKYVVEIDGEKIGANSRPELIKKVLEKALEKGWITHKDFPIRFGNSIFASLEPISGLQTGIRNFQIQSFSLYVNVGNSGQAQQQKIRHLINFLSQRVQGNCEILNI